MSELRYRVDITEKALCHYYSLGSGLEETYDYCEIEETPEFELRSMVIFFMFVQLNSIFDCQGSFSLCAKYKKDQKKYLISESRLKKIFPILADEEIVEYRDNLNNLFQKHKNTIRTIKKVRNNMMAHMGIEICSERIDKWGNAAFSLRTTVPKSFRFKRIQELCSDLHNSLFPIRMRLETSYANTDHELRYKI